MLVAACLSWRGKVPKLRLFVCSRSTKEVLRYWERRLNYGRSSFRSVWRVYYYYIRANNIITGAN